MVAVFAVFMLIMVMIVFGFYVLMLVVMIAFFLLVMMIVVPFPQAAFSELQQLQTLYLRHGDDFRFFRKRFEGTLQAWRKHLPYPENHARFR